MLTVRRLLASRGLVTIAGALVTAIVALAGYVVLARPLAPEEHYCALMPDAIGLYPGTHVKLRGVVVGSVTAVRLDAGSVRVDFDIDADHRLHGDVAAATVATTLAADRDLAVLPGHSTETPWDPDRCVTRTLTPKSISETLRAANELMLELNSPDDPDLVGRTLRQLREATAGTGGQADALLTQLASGALSSDATVVRLGALIDSLGSLSAATAANWAEYKQVLTRFPAVFDQINNEIFAELAELADSLRVILPWANDITREYGGAILGGLDAVVPYIRLLASHAGTLERIVDAVPVLVGAFTRMAGPDGQPMLTWTPPRVHLPQHVGAAVCAAVDALEPGRCSAADAVAAIDLATFVFGMTGGR
ncbi:MCE family protein [Nocardia otitidiscaviarum]|uniref:MlaD family protein n=1 Tax=Nocardia otitidiscaviarum TaxID=1823 RepID=UPI0004A7218B|nr:MlaD family protein [Nocardia otitidiscaviarum]MBF6132339.1 MCE family protein [Nocardia otitidiscaviarum]MBF6483431.1 MCE family protein [Nocardia otitidiscaviarum]